MLTTTFFLELAKWSAVLTIASAVVTVLGFIFKWGIRFRLVGSTGFMGVLTAGLFSLSLVPLTHTAVPGSVHYKLVYDTGGAQTVISVPPTISNAQLDATMRQAASDLYSYGRLGRAKDNLLTIRVRTVIHPSPGVSKPLYLGEVRRSLAIRDDEQLNVQVFPENLAQLPKSTA
ncbi:Ycf51 family protein [Coleofasciculus sp. FACHB-129]|uniref:Ycf51 family protein n=1 Tax=Cyanophyceae TaxID=3028117 RepID=UPI00168608DE|nr:Ycf51 family protein [Coleofasciculus sp. FACHB-129]MBD1894678.1 Ycf51 family protein [Coleofasciculus sp. FACHB-129]